jgi:hypothetical protein
MSIGLTAMLVMGKKIVAMIARYLLSTAWVLVATASTLEASAVNCARKEFG